MSTKPTNTKIRSLFFIALILLCVLLYGVYTSGGFGMLNSQEENKQTGALNYETVLPTKTAEATESIDYYWADYQITLEEWTLSPAILKQPLMNCTGFTYTLYLGDIQSGSPYGEWTLYAETTGGAWIYLDSFHAPRDTTQVDITLWAPMDIYALCAVRKLHTECTHTYAYGIEKPKYGDGTADGYYNYQLFRYYCTEHQQYRVGANGNMVTMMRRNSSNEATDPAIQTLRNFIVAGGEWQNRLSKFSTYHEAVNALLPSLNSGNCHWVREWNIILTTAPLQEESSTSEDVEFGILFVYGGEKWQGRCVKTPYQVSPRMCVNQATWDSRFAK